MTKLRSDMPPLPARIAKLPVSDRGYPVPWFVAWIDGKPEFRTADGRKYAQAVKEGRCWVCGQKFEGKEMTFVIGPMCAVNRISSEPPSHHECAVFSAVACPFLSRPHMVRREGGMPDEVQSPAGHMIERNPGVTLLWTTRKFKIVRVDNGQLISMGEPVRVECYAEGKLATPEQITKAVETGLPLLREIAQKQGIAALKALRVQEEIARKLLGIAA